MTVFGREFEVDGAEQRNGCLTNAVLANGADSRAVVESEARSPTTCAGTEAPDSLGGVTTGTCCHVTAATTCDKPLVSTAVGSVTTVGYDGERTSSAKTVGHIIANQVRSLRLFDFIQTLSGAPIQKQSRTNKIISPEL